MWLQVVAGQQEQISQLMQDVAQRDTQLAAMRSECEHLRQVLLQTALTASAVLWYNFAAP